MSDTLFTIILLVGIVIAIYKMIRYYQFYTASKNVREWVLSYQRRCTGNNRFIVTKQTLQDSFPEYNSDLIDKVWLMLVRERIIVEDPMDGEWCIR